MSQHEHDDSPQEEQAQQDQDNTQPLQFRIEIQPPLDEGDEPSLRLHIHPPQGIPQPGTSTQTTTLPNGDQITITTQVFIVDPTQPAHLPFQFAILPDQAAVPFLFPTALFTGPAEEPGENSSARGRYRFHPYIRIIPIGGQPSFQGQPPASTLAISLLKKFPSTTTNIPSALTTESCVVCQDTLLTSDQDKQDKQDVELCQMPCQHVFHSSCLLPWLKRSNTCPTCRWEISTDNSEYNLGVKRRMMDRRILTCALAGIGCDDDDYMHSTESTPSDDASIQYSLVDGKPKDDVVLDCACKFHQSCLARSLRVQGFHHTQGTEALDVKCPRCRKQSLVQSSILQVGLV